MASIDILRFSGSAPAIAKNLLPENVATEATNCNFETGQIRASKGALFKGNRFSSQNRKTIFLYNKNPSTKDGFWFQRDGDVDFVRGPVANDQLLRIYYTGDGAPKFTFVDIAQGGSANSPYPLGSRALGIPAPGWFMAEGPSLEIILNEDGTETDPTDGNQIISTSYVLTYVSDLGEEGPPSPPTPLIERYDGGAVTLSGIPVPSGSSNITRKRLYRIELNGVYQFVAELFSYSTSYYDSSTSASLGEPLPSEGWIAPHADMKGLVALPNGILAGFWGNTVAFSVPYMPHAWPIANRLALDCNIVGLGVSAYGLVVATVATPYLIVGSTADSMQQQKLDVVQACISKRSIVDMGDFIIYASAEGLVAIGGQEVKVLSRGQILQEQWQEKYKPETIHAYRWKDRYLGFYGTGSAARCFTFHPSEGFLDYSVSCTAAWLDAEDGKLYMANGTGLYEWQGGTPLVYSWISKEFHVSAANPFQVCKVDMESYAGSHEIEFYRNGSLFKRKVLTDSKAFRLGVSQRYNKLHFKIRGTQPVNRIQLATSMSEIY